MPGALEVHIMIAVERMNISSNSSEATMDFPVVAIGASAGGLEAVTELLASLPNEVGAAFVIIQHLDPDHKSQLTDLLARRTASHYRIAKIIRDMCSFARHDLTRDPPFSRLELVSCRNLLIDFDATVQRRVMQVFHYALRSHGLLMLGPAESVGPASDLFELTDKHHKIYLSKAAVAGTALVFGQVAAQLTPQSPRPTGDAAPTRIEFNSAQREFDRLQLARYAPASLLIDSELTILQFRGETPYLEPASGAPSNKLQRVVRPDLLVEISPAIQEARENSIGAQREGLRLDDFTDVNVEVHPISTPNAGRCYLITFEDTSRRRRGPRTALKVLLSESEKDRRLAQQDREIMATRDYLQSRMEEHEAVKEQLKSSHEEVLLAGEEFQSTNEELETAKEELQSANEELTTANDELRDRNHELAVLNGELQKARAASERARKYADAIVTTVRESLLIIDENLQVARANQAYYEHFKTTPGQTEGRLLTALEPGPWNDSALFERLIAVIKDNADMRGFELQYRDAVGEVRLLKLNARKIPADDDRAALILLAIVDSTVEKVQAVALRLSDERLRAAVTAVRGTVWTNNAMGEMTDAQPDWEVLTGQTLEEYQGFGWTNAVHPDDVQPTIEAWQKTVAKREPFLFEHRVRRRDGDYREFSIHAIPLFDGAGVLQQWVGIHVDVTDLRRLERERAHLLEAEQTARSQAESANRVKDEFLATLSHELRTPITIIVGWSRMMLKRHSGGNADLAKGLHLIINNAMMQSQLISDLLDMSSIVSGKTIINVKPLDLTDCIEQIVTAQQIAAKDKGISLTLEQDAEPKVVLGDSARLQQIIGNLLTNALKFTPAGGNVTVRAHRVGETLEVSIEDTGEGISPEFLPQVFGRFKQADGTGARLHGGLGLGLAIVKQLVEMLGGTVRAESQGRGQGARFTIALPARPTPPFKVFSEQIPEEREQHAVAGLRGTRALVVEDNVSMLEFLIRILEEQGAVVIGVQSASAAIEALQAPNRISFNLLVSDIGLPGLDGYELLRRVRGELNLSVERLPAVAVTAFGRKEDREHALGSGFQAHLSKPYEVAQLVSILRQVTQPDSSAWRNTNGPGN